MMQVTHFYKEMNLETGGATQDIKFLFNCFIIIYFDHSSSFAGPQRGGAAACYQGTFASSGHLIQIFFFFINCA